MRKSFALELHGEWSEFAARKGVTTPNVTNRTVKALLRKPIANEKVIAIGFETQIAGR
jgi:hypothetical protein